MFLSILFVATSLSVTNNVPPLMTCADGSRVDSVAKWETVRRPELLRTFLANVYGVRPVERPEDLRFEVDSCAPETWFHIIGGNASKEGIVADLDAIAEAGISGIQFFHGHADGGLWPGVVKPISCLSADWEDLVKFTSEECHKRGLTFKMQNCPGWSMSGGPWVTPDKAMRRLVCLDPAHMPKYGPDDDYHEIGRVTFEAADDSRDKELVHVYPNPQQLNHAWAYEPKTNLNGRACPPGAWQDSAPMTFAETGASKLDMWEAKAGWGLRQFTMSTNTAPVKTKGKKTLVFGHVNAKRKNHPAPPEGTGWECDKMDPRGFEANWNGYLGKLLQAGVKIDGTLVDSWECSVQTWTWKMEEEFEKRNGYKLRPWLPALFGYVLKSEAETERFLLDWRNTCSRLIEENYYGTIARLAHEHGMTAQYETAFGDVIVGDILRYWKYADEPMCEFWSPHDDAKGSVGSHDFKPVLPCVSAAHVYGKRRVSAEALTSFELTFDENFKDWKKIVDRHFGRGVTHIVFHTYTHNPVVNGKPPSTSFGGHIGSPFLRKQTWWPYLKEFTKYLAFCGRELERGQPAVDILMYLGDDVNHKPSERELLFENRYKYDYCNADALRSFSVIGGRLAVKVPGSAIEPETQNPKPETMSYRVLWIPKGTFLLPETEARIAEFERQGARVIRGDFTPDWPSPLKAMTGREGKDVHWYQRRDGDEDIFFIAQPDGRSCFEYFKGGKLVKTVDPVDGKDRSGRASAARDAKSSVTLRAAGARPERGCAAAKTYEPWATYREYRYSFTRAAGARPERGETATEYQLDLGDVRDWATVWVNGREAARLWCEPYRCDITPFVKEGENEIRIEVTSTWYNTLVHEAALPQSERTTWTKCGPKAVAPMRPAGLLGPVELNADLPIPALIPAPRKLVKTRGVFAAPSAYVTRDWISFVRDATLPPEGYRLSVTPEKVTVAAADVRGELQAMTTLRQLGGERMPYRHEVPLTGAERSLPLRIPCCEIEDAPAYRWRGMLIDECRHYFGKETVKHVLDMMAFHKYNVLHWHLTEDQGWRIVIDKYPKLVEYGAVRPSSPIRYCTPSDLQNGEKYGPFYYTKDDVREIVAYAAARGIEIVPEIEFPGHIRAALAAYPEFSCVGDKLKRVPRCKWGIEGEVLCVGNDAAVKFVEDVLDEVIELFPCEYFHIGGDECPTTRWKECPKCQAKAKALGLAGPEKLQSWVTTHFTEYLGKKGKRVIGWDEILSGNIPTTAGVMSWRGTSGGIKASKAGHDVVICPQSHCYFNRKAGLAEDPFMPRNEREVISLEKVYSFDPVAGVPDEYRPRVMGSQACFWSESIWNQYDLDWRMWPRSCALAEVLWTAPEKRDFGEFKRRVRAHRKVLIDYGVNCSPLE